MDNELYILRDYDMEGREENCDYFVSDYGNSAMFHNAVKEYVTEYPAYNHEMLYRFLESEGFHRIHIGGTANLTSCYRQARNT